MKCLRSQRGFALLAVPCVMLMILIYLVAVQGAVELTRAQGRLTAQRQDAAEAMASLVTLALAANRPPGTPVAFTAPSGRAGRVTRTPLPEGHALWRSLPLIKPLAGDELLTVDLEGAPGAGPSPGRFIVNGQGLRQGAIALDPDAAGKPAEPK